MKNSKGETLPQPYLDLARMRSEKLGNAHADLLLYAFTWIDTVEGNEFWNRVELGDTPTIPAASLAELEEWRKAQQIAKMPSKIEPAEPDYKAKYEEMKAERDYYRHEYELKSIDLDDIDNKPTTTRNWVAECAMAFFANNRDMGFVECWTKAEVWVKEGKERGHIN